MTAACTSPTATELALPPPPSSSRSCARGPSAAGDCSSSTSNASSGSIPMSAPSSLSTPTGHGRRPMQPTAHRWRVDRPEHCTASRSPSKDCLETRGVRTAAGAAVLAGHVPDRDATVVALVRAADALVVGKTNLPEWASDSQTSSELFGETHDPWDLTCSPSGSSAGPTHAARPRCGRPRPRPAHDRGSRRRPRRGVAVGAARTAGRPTPGLPRRGVPGRRTVPTGLLGHGRDSPPPATRSPPPEYF